MSNDTGVITKALVDLQRFLACAFASLPQVDNNMKTGFKTVVASTSVSARVSLVIKSNNALRTVGSKRQMTVTGMTDRSLEVCDLNKSATCRVLTGPLLYTDLIVFMLLVRTLWQKVVDFAKEALDCKAALLKASEMTGALVSLEKALVANETPCLWKWTAVAPVNDILELLVGHDTLTDEQSILVTKLQDAKGSICQQAPSWETMVPKLGEFLNKQWLSCRVGELPHFFKLTHDDNMKDMLTRSTSAGRSHGKGFEN